MVLKRNFLAFFVSLLLVALLTTACGGASTASSPTPTPAPTTASAPTATPTTASAPTATPTTASSSGAVVQTASATIAGKSVMILTNSQGLTLYYRTSDTATSVCTGGCAQAWPPLLSSGSGTPTSSSTLPGTLAVLNDANGAQVTYQGHPLYTFASDTKPGQTTGQGIAGIWFVATTSLAAKGSSGGAATPTPTSSGY
jgi:predicted lipoprotein with Yx(FWY)xxD motif